MYVTNPNLTKKRQKARSRYQYMREAIAVLCGGRKPNLKMVEAYFTTDDERLQWWCFEKRSCDWMTGIGIIEASRALFDESDSNGNVIEVKNWELVQVEMVMDS